MKMKQKISYLFSFLVLLIVFGFFFFTCNVKLALHVNGQELEDIEISLEPQTIVYNGGVEGFILKGKNASLEGFTIQYYQSGSLVEAINVGTYDITITREADETYKAFNETIIDGLTINKKSVIVQLETSEFVYNTNDQLADVKAYYEDVNSQKVYLELIEVKNNENSVVTEFKNAGSYHFYYEMKTGEEQAYYQFVDGKDTYKIDIEMAKAVTTIDTTGITCVYTYSGKTYEITSGAKLNHNESIVEYSNNSFTDAGPYYVTISSQASNNYQESNQLLSVIVNKAEAIIDTTEIKTEYTYDGNKITINQAKLNHDETTIQYIGNEFTNADTYVVKMSAPATKNYLAVAEMSIQVVVNKAKTVIDSSKIEKDYVYQESYIVINSGATINHNEATLQYIDNVFDRAGKHILELKVDESTNYEGAIEYLDIIIDKAQSVLDVTGFQTEYEYNGKNYVIKSGATLNHNETDIIYSDNVLDEIGAYTIKLTVNETDNYYGISKDIDVTLVKGTTIIDVSGVNTIITYNGQDQTFKYGATINHNETHALYSYNTYREVGKYQIMVRAEETDHYKQADVMVDVEIVKAKYDMSGVHFIDKVTKYNGQLQGIEISGKLPTGADGVTVTVSYSEGFTEIGTRIITATFTGSENYEEIQPMSAILTIQKENVKDKEINPTIILDLENGFASDVTTLVDVLVRDGTVLANENSFKINYNEILKNHEELKDVYQVLLFKDSKAVKVSDLSSIAIMKVKLLVPDELKDECFKLYYVNNNGVVNEITKGDSATITTYVMEDSYCVFKATSLGEYAFVKEVECHYEWIVLPVILIFVGLFILALFVLKLKKDKLIISIGLVVYGLLLVILSIRGYCSICTVFDIIGFATLLAMAIIFLIKKKIVVFKKKEIKETKQLTKRELAHMDNKR